MKDTYLLDNYSINFKGNLISLTRPVVMSILNTTPDSFFDGGKYNSIEKALKKVEKDLNQGATIIDIGGYSTKPRLLLYILHGLLGPLVELLCLLI